ncbi:hypothetical protein Q8F55_000473 [Vanrija albida]|uniref:non-specific serine/threonine protein kinase n=1 Tax=Vanrija albida TaxID=181172 RepID=A0ABR3QEC6_9TREE
MAAAGRRQAATSQPSGSSQGYADISEMDKYKLVSNIGKGSFGVISKVQRVEDGKEFALKQLDYGKMTERDRKQILAEVAILESLKHRNIVQLVQKIKDPKNERIFIVMEYCPSGDLGSIIRRAQRTNQPLNEDKIWNIFLQITLALHHCHWPNERTRYAGSRLSAPSEAGPSRTQVLHRDLKPENVFMSGEFVKLGDFGLSKDMAGCTFTSTYVGTPLYMPPEILAENRYDTKSDIWSLGCLVFEMCALSSPFSAAKTQQELISMVKSGKLPPLPSNISPSLKAVIRAMLNLNPVRRPSTKDILEMDEMKLHRKLFMVQNQTVILAARKEEIQQYEARLHERAAAIERREQAMAEREATLVQREQSVAEREDILRENNKRITTAAESLKAQWEKLREEKESHKEAVAALQVEAVPQPSDDKVLPVPSTSRLPRHHSYDDTPSKIPFPSAFASPVPLDARLTSKIAGLPSGSKPSSLARRLASKSLTNLASRARDDDDLELPSTQATPAKRAAAPGTPFRRQHRTSIGSPGELERHFLEDVTMATASPSSTIFPTPFSQRRRKDSAVSEDAPPSLIPAPTFVFRPEATPAKWSPDDPDLPSPFLRRAAPAQPSFGATTERVVAEQREPLAAINAQPFASAGNTASGAAAQTHKAALPRSKSGASLHQRVLRHNAVRTSDHGVAAAPAPVVPNGLGSLSGSAVRTRPIAGRDPARC